MRRILPYLAMLFMQAISLDPRYAIRRTREFVYGTKNGDVILSSKGWLGSYETTLFKSTEPIQAIRRRGMLLGWATPSSAHVYDMSMHVEIGSLDQYVFERFRDGSSANVQKSDSRGISDSKSSQSTYSIGHCIQTVGSATIKWFEELMHNRCVLEWIGPRKLAYGFLEHVLIANIVSDVDNSTKNGISSSSASTVPTTEDGSGDRGPKTGQRTLRLRIASAFDIQDGILTGIAPFLNTNRLLALIVHLQRETTHSPGESNGGKNGDGVKRDRSSEVDWRFGVRLRMYDVHGGLHSDDLLEHCDEENVVSPQQEKWMPPVTLAFHGPEDEDRDPGAGATAGATAVGLRAEDKKADIRSIPWADTLEKLYYVLGRKVWFGRNRNLRYEAGENM